ncbi:MAG: hypothetical protein QNJ16_21605 [Rhodobacter sp.]|nr:hypothetical protein [Rhodobacter sp.]
MVPFRRMFISWNLQIWQVFAPGSHEVDEFDPRCSDFGVRRLNILMIQRDSGVRRAGANRRNDAGTVDRSARKSVQSRGERLDYSEMRSCPLANQMLSAKIGPRGSPP